MTTPRLLLTGALSLSLAGWAVSVVAVSRGVGLQGVNRRRLRLAVRPDDRVDGRENARFRASRPRRYGRPSRRRWSNAAGAAVDYTRQVKTIIDENCLECHSQDKRKGGLSLATYEDLLEGGRSGAVVRPGSGERSLILDRITGAIEPQMPKDEMALDAANVGDDPSLDRPGCAARADGAGSAAAVGGAARAEPSVAAGASSGRPGRRRSTGSPRPTLRAGSGAQPVLVSDALFARRVYLGHLGPAALARSARRRSSPTAARTSVTRLVCDAARRQARQVRRALDLVLERSAAQRRRRQLLLGDRRAQEHHRLAALRAGLEPCPTTSSSPVCSIPPRRPIPTDSWSASTGAARRAPPSRRGCRRRRTPRRFSSASI